MMITAKNYAAQACSDLSEIIKKFRNINGWGTDIKNLEIAINKIKSSVHFALPDNGKILGDGLRGLIKSKIRLPYNQITIEYYFSDNIFNRSDETSIVRKRLILAEQIDDGIRVCCFFYLPHEKSWMLWPLFIDINEGWDDVENYDKISCYTGVVDSMNDGGLYVRHNGAGVLLPAALELFVKNSNGVEYAIKRISCDINDEIYVVLEMLEALSCRNVTESIYQKKICKLKKRKVKTELFETKILVVDAGRTNISNNSGNTGTHASPRQHLRRGHIRRLPSGNIWVNSCVVGDSKNGVIAKQYNIRAA